MSCTSRRAIRKLKIPSSIESLTDFYTPAKSVTSTASVLDIVEKPDTDDWNSSSDEWAMSTAEAILSPTSNDSESDDSIERIIEANLNNIKNRAGRKKPNPLSMNDLNSMQIDYALENWNKMFGEARSF